MNDYYIIIPVNNQYVMNCLLKRFAVTPCCLTIGWGPHGYRLCRLVKTKASSQRQLVESLRGADIRKGLDYTIPTDVEIYKQIAEDYLNATK